MLRPVRRRWASLPTAAGVLAVLLATAGCQGGASSDTAQPAATEQRPRVAYVALGDSYTAGPGIPETDPDDPCLRSTGNYPHRVADRLEELGNDVELVDVSCSGATTRDLAKGQLTGGEHLTPQLDALDGLDEGPARPTLVTVGIGGNDLGLFRKAMLVCSKLSDRPGVAPCRRHWRSEGGDELRAILPETRRRVAETLREVRRRVPHADIVLVGYPQLVPADGTCAELPLAAGDYPYVRGILHGMSQALEDAAERVGVRFVDLRGPSRGHDICAEEPWVEGIQGDPDVAFAYHPFDVEQQAVAELILSRMAG